MQRSWQEHVLSFCAQDLPMIQQLQQGLRRVSGCRLMGLVEVVQAVARGADAHFARLEGDPLALAHHRHARRAE